MVKYIIMKCYFIGTACINAIIAKPCIIPLWKSLIMVYYESWIKFLIYICGVYGQPSIFIFILLNNALALK